MRKTLLLLAATLAALALSAQPTSRLHRQAAPAPRTQAAQKLMPLRASHTFPDIPRSENAIYDPQGTPKYYIATYTYQDAFTDPTVYTCGKMEIRESQDGDSLYVNGFAPGWNYEETGSPESWIAMTRNGNDITLKGGQVLVKNDLTSNYLQIVHLNADGTVATFEDEMHFTIDEEGTIRQNDEQDILIVYKDGATLDEAGTFAFLESWTLEDLGELPDYQFPESATPEAYVMRYADSYTQTESMRRVNACFDGNDFYIQGLSISSEEDIFKGTVSGNTVTIPANQILKNVAWYWWRLAEATLDASSDELILNQSIVFTIGDDGRTLTMTPQSDYLVEVDYRITTAQKAWNRLSLTPQEADKPAKPAAPSFMALDYYNKDLQIAHVVIPNTDTEGNYINESKLAYRFYIDGELFTFTPGDYDVETSMTDIPYDYANNTDIYNNTTYRSIFFRNLDGKKTIELESVYTVDGVATCSDRVTKNLVSGIAQTPADKQPIEVRHTDLQGRRIAIPAQGTLTLRTTTWSDGTVSTEKIIN